MGFIILHIEWVLVFRLMEFIEMHKINMKLDFESERVFASQSLLY